MQRLPTAASFSSHTAPSKALPTREPLKVSKFVSRTSAAFGVVCMMLAPVYDGGESEALLANGALLVGMAALSSWVAHVQKDVPFRIFQVLVWLAMMQPAALLLATLLEGEVLYASSLGLFSHHDGAAFIAFAYALFYASAVLSWSLVNVRRHAWKSSFTEMINTLPGLSLTGVLLLAAGLIPARLATNFDLGVPLKAQYFLRVYLAIFSGAVFFVGVALRRSHQRMLSYPVAAGLVLMMVLALLGGNRHYFVEGVGMMVFGVLIGLPTKRKVWLTVLSTLAAFLVVGMYVGEVLRTGDSLGRSGDAALARLEGFDERLQSEAHDITVRQSSLRRILRNSTHAVMTMVPEYMPFEEEGVLKIPGEFLKRIFPDLNYSGYDENKLPRNHMLNELGFVVNQETSFELALVPDAWYRAGYWGLVLVGLLLGFLTAVGEQVVYSLLAAVPEMQLFFIFSLSAIWMVEGRDIVWGFRAFIHSLAATFLFALSIYIVRYLILLRTTRLGDAQTTSMNARNTA